ncbi:caprin homolog [Diabrotica virgifera virgifera]|uniref:Caprin-1 dimerization domain-containing protein n=1 Tax=Diabrotica virgifera virgifera TaxID=50390 RepID=A0ABM5IVE4_DIAVI|nr:caprin homolog [Diabrotica virgifera virgifera]
MPSAASVKIDKQINPENALAESAQNLTPLRQAITVIEHKIRNLEKRKSKLESYKDLQNAGKELNADQKTAVAKFNEVTNTLDFARDLCKQFLGIAVASEKEAKKIAKKEAAAKYQAELARLREILLVQDALNQMGNETVREDFLQGRNGAAQLTESDLKLLDDLYPEVTPKHEAGNATAFMNEVQAAAEHLLAAVDGKPKEVFGGSYSQIKEILGKIHESGYFDQAQVYEEFAVVEPELVEEPEVLPSEPLNNHETGAVMVPPPPQPLPEPTQPTTTAPPPDMPLIESLTIENRATLHQAPPTPVEQPPLEPPTLTNEPPMFYQQLPQQPPPPQPQPPRPITEMLGTGSFFFLQDSEIDPPEQIASQTFTNQNFTGHPSHPVQLPPPHFANMPNNLTPNNHQLPQMQMGNNGIDDTLRSPEETLQIGKDGGAPPNRGPPRPNNNQSYYQNNGYNRPRQQNQNRNASGPRPTATRHA